MRISNDIKAANGFCSDNTVDKRIVYEQNYANYICNLFTLIESNILLELRLRLYYIRGYFYDRNNI